MNCEEEQSEHKSSYLKSNKFSEEQQQSANSSSHSPSFCVSHNVHLNNTCRTQNLCFPVATKQERERERDTHTHTHKSKRRREKQINKTSTRQQLFSLLLILLSPPTPSQNSCWIHTMFLQDSRISPRIPPLACLIHRSCCWLPACLVGCHPRTHPPQ